MALKYVFLILGILFSVASKIMQFKFKMQLGDIVVIPAGIFLTLAMLFSFTKYTVLFNEENRTIEAVIISILACLAVVMFQLMMIQLVGRHNRFGFIYILPLLITLGAFIFKWIKL
jgi:hypothetical protein